VLPHAQITPAVQSMSPPTPAPHRATDNRATDTCATDNRAIDHRAAGVPAPFDATGPILVIDDDPDDRCAYIRLLRKASYRNARFVEAASGPLGLAAFDREPFAAVLLDYALPGMNGLQVLREIRARNSFVPVIFMTGQGDVAIAVQALRDGATDYLDKAAVDAERLCEAVCAGMLKGSLAAKDAEILAKTEALRASEERNRLLLGSLSEDAVIMLDPDGLVVSWNPSAERIDGYLAEDVLGRHFSLFFRREDIEAGLPEAELETARRTGNVSAKGWRVRKDGSEFLAHVTIDAIRDENAVLRGFAKVTRDVTNGHILEEQLRIVVEATPTGILILNEAGRITMANIRAADIFGYPPGILLGEPVTTLIPDAPDATDGAWHAAMRDRRDIAAPLPDRHSSGRRRDGSTVMLEVDWSPVHTPRGRIVVASVFDVTARLRAQAEREASEARTRADAIANQARLEALAHNLAEARLRAEEANAAKSRFLTGVTHEMRTPLNGILGYAQLLGEEGGLNPAQTARVKTMLVAGQHLLDMINAVLDLSQIESGQIELRNLSVDLLALGRACFDVVRPAADAKCLALRLIRSDEAPSHFVVDPTRLRQVLINLLGNAVKFTPAGSLELRLLPGSTQAGLRLEVVDTGPGIPAGQREKLFHEFERLDAAHGQMEGSGLGLVITARLVQRMGGQIGHAENPAGGSVFWIDLPGGQSANAAAPVIVPASEKSARLRILVVDDVEMNRDVAAGFLRFGGHLVVTVDSGAAAIDAVAGNDFDVVLMDVRMPGIDGLEATRRIRALPAPRGTVPVVAMTAQVFAEQIVKCRDAGMDAHVSKPIDRAGLLATVAAAAAAPRVSRPPAQHLPVIDEAAYDEAASVLPQAALDQYLRTLIERGEALQARLQAPFGAADLPDLAHLAHALAGSAGMLGARRLTDAGRLFERAAAQNAPDVAAHAQRLDKVTGDALAVLRARVGAAMANA
jgi:PAS domain S-box-containing protein